MNRNLPKIELFNRPKGLVCEPPAAALAKWHPEIRAADSDGISINIYSEIGETWDGTGVTVRMINGILRQNKGKDITLNINSPGGDFFEGNAIYNILRDHDGDVHVRIIGLAASAASVIAMAGNTIEIAESGFLMIHNAWTIAIGDKNAFQDVADTLAKFDEAMAGVYFKRAEGLTEKEIARMMDNETWLSGKEAVEKGFADSLLAKDELGVDENEKSGKNAALRTIDTALAKMGIPRSQRREMFKEISGTPSAAADPATPCAGNPTSEVLSGLLASLTSYEKELTHVEN